MSVELITAWEELVQLEGPWNVLAGGAPMRSWDWLATWWKHYGGIDHHESCGGNGAANRQLHVLAIYDNEPGNEDRAEFVDNRRSRQLVGIAPWYLDRTVVKGNVLRWLGGGEVCTDHVSILSLPDFQERVAAEVVAALTEWCDEWDRLELNAVDADDAAIATLVEELENRECIVSRHAADSCWKLELPTSWDDYLATISKSHRKQLRRLEREALDSGRAEWHQVKSVEDFSRGWEILVDLHQRRRRSLGEPGCFASRLFHDFHHDVAARLLARGQLRMSWLSLDGTPAAAEYHFADSSTTYAYQGGVDPARLDEEPGRVSTIACLRAAIAEGHQHLDFLRGDEPYKAHWRAERQATFNYHVVPNRRLARLRGRVLMWADTVSDWLKDSHSASTAEANQHFSAPQVEPAPSACGTE